MWLKVLALYLFVFSVAISEAHAYIGPGLGAGTLGIILGFLGSIALAILAIFWYPIKKILKKTTKSAPPNESKQTESDSEKA